LKRGEVYWADLAPRSGSEQQGRRPVIIVSNDALNWIQSWNRSLLSRSQLQQLNEGVVLRLFCCHKALLG